MRHREHLIQQFHFTGWPDHGVPKFATALLEFHKKVDEYHKHKSYQPMLVHCRYICTSHLIIHFHHDYSAGVGRSGMFIAINTEIQRMKKKGIIDVYSCVRNMRFWRNFMVQTLVS